MNKEEMKQYTCTKTVKAMPMKYIEANSNGAIPEMNECLYNVNPDGYYVEDDGRRYWVNHVSFEEDYKLSETFDNRMTLELEDLAKRMCKYDNFISSDEFGALDTFSCALLTVQRGLMGQYYLVLADRFIKANKAKIKLSNFTFGTAVLYLKAGMAVRRAGWNGKGLFVVKQVPARISADIIPKMQSLPQSAKDIIMARKEPHIDYTNQMLIVNPDGRADSWVPSSSDVFAEDWELVTE